MSRAGVHAASQSCSEDVANKASWREWWIPALLCTVFLAQIWLSSPRVSQTADEATHLYSGYRYLKCGDLTVSPEHPPLAKVVAALPLLWMKADVNCDAFTGDDFGQSLQALQWMYSGNWRAKLLWARFADSIFAGILLIIVWVVARHFFGRGTAIVASVLLVFEPTLLANGPQVMTDMAVTAMLPLAVYGCYLCLQKKTLPWIALAGVAVGATLLSKASGVVVLPAVAISSCVQAFWGESDKASGGRTLRDNLLRIAAVFLVAYVVLWMGYGMRFAPRTGYVQPPVSTSTMPAQPKLGGLAWVEQYHLLPEAYVQGMDFTVQASSSSSDIRQYLLGKQYNAPPWYTLPIHVLVRSTVAVLAMCLLAAGGLFLCMRRYRAALTWLLVPAVLVLAACMHSALSGGIRYMLPSLPFVLMLVAAGCMELWQRYRWMHYALPCLLAMHVASSLHAYPNYLSYANELWGGPSQTYKYIPVDIGQGYEEVRRYTEAHPSQPCYLLTDWQWDPEYYGIHCHAFGYPWRLEVVPEQLQGTVIVSSRMLNDFDYFREIASEPFRRAQPVAKIAGSALLVYQGTFDTHAAASVSARYVAISAVQRQDLSQAMELLNYAIKLEPDDLSAFWLRARVWTEFREPLPALSDLLKVRELSRKYRLSKADSDELDHQITMLRNALM